MKAPPLSSLVVVVNLHLVLALVMHVTIQMIEMTGARVM